LTADRKPADAAEGDGDAAETTPDVALLRLAEALPPVTDTEDALAAYCEKVAAGTGPVAIDAERASGYRYSNRAYLIQVRREGAGTALIDPIPLASLAPLQEAIGDAEWILHAATQDLPCLAEVGLKPVVLFDTELAGRLLNYPRVGLATLVETLIGVQMLKEHSAVDWSTRPLPTAWLEYAALDVEVLVELRDILAGQLEEAGKDDWARQEFDHLLGFEVTPRVDAWRRTSGLHKVRGRRSLAAVKLLWETRDEIARERDVTPGRLIPDSAIVAAASALPTDRGALMTTPGFHGRGASRHAKDWLAALKAAVELPDDQLPSRAGRGDGPPNPRSWAEKDPVAARRLELARAAITEVAKDNDLPAENLLTPDTLRRVMWAPPRTREPVGLLEAVIDQLRGMGARSWQVGLTAPALTQAVLDADASLGARGAQSSVGSGSVADSDDEPEGEPDGGSDGS
jgi:ribonuclease D